MCLFVHARGTTGRHARARRRFAHAARCEQCGAALTETTRVAAHVVVYPCGNPCVGVLTLRTACKACNHPAAPRPRWWGRWRGWRRAPRLGMVLGRPRRPQRRRTSATLSGAGTQASPSRRQCGAGHVAALSSQSAAAQPSRAACASSVP